MILQKKCRLGLSLSELSRNLTYTTFFFEKNTTKKIIDDDNWQEFGWKSINRICQMSNWSLWLTEKSEQNLKQSSSLAADAGLDNLASVVVLDKNNRFCLILIQSMISPFPLPAVAGLEDLTAVVLDLKETDSKCNGPRSN